MLRRDATVSVLFGNVNLSKRSLHTRIVSISDDQMGFRNIFIPIYGKTFSTYRRSVYVTGMSERMFRDIGSQGAINNTGINRVNGSWRDMEQGRVCLYFKLIVCEHTDGLRYCFTFIF